MLEVEPPEGFHWHWERDTVRVQLPDVQATESHLLEPFLPGATAIRLARAMEALAPRAGDASGKPSPALRQVTLAYDARYAPETIERFADRLAAALAAVGLEPTIVRLPVEPLPAAPLDSASESKPSVDPGAETDSGTAPEFLEKPHPPADRPARVTPPRRTWRERFRHGHA